VNDGLWEDWRIQYHMRSYTTSLSSTLGDSGLMYQLIYCGEY